MAVTTGLQALLSDEIGGLEGLTVGVTANHAAVTSDLVHIADALQRAGVRVGALFGPEHGARGDIADGVSVEDFVDERLGVPVYSLYGRVRRPTAEMLKGIDVMLVDVQDVGARFYTFVHTMAEVMKGCGEHGTPVWVLDRPNPITGRSPEGPVLEPEFASFVGLFGVPVRHGLTAGELALLFAGRFGISCDLRVVKMSGWNREMYYDATGLPWVMPSPNMPSLDTAVVYPGTCLLEGTNVSEGRGTTRPFEVVGAPWVDAGGLRDRVLEYALPGVAFREAYFSPCDSKFRGESCSGLQVYVTSREEFRPVLTGVAIVSAFHDLYPNEFAFRPPAEHGRRFFDLLAGTARVRESIESGLSPWEIAESWDEEVRGFVESARSILLY